MGKPESAVLEDGTGKSAEEVLAEAEARAAAIVKEAEELAAKKLAAAEKAVKPKPEGGKAKGKEDEELVPVRLFKDNDKYKDDVFVAINGKSWQIKRGETVMVPRYVARFIEESLKQDLDTAKMLEQKQREFQEETKARNL